MEPDTSAGEPRGETGGVRGRHLLVPSALVVTAAANALWLAYKILRGPALVVREGGLTINVNPDAEYAFMKTRIAAALVVAAAGLVWRGARGAGISTLALLWVVGEYAAWWLKSFNLVYNSEAQSFSKLPHTAFLHGAGLWDVWVLAVVITVIVWKLRTRQAFRPRPGRQLTPPAPQSGA